MNGVENDFTKFSFHYIGKAASNLLNLIQRELLILHPQDFNCIDLGPLQSPIHAFRGRVMIRNKNKPIRVIQIHRQLTGALSFFQLVASPRRTLWKPEP